MSKCLARFMQPTGLEFHDTAFKIDSEIWNFLTHEIKRKMKSQEGQLPIRYWQTHAVPLHQKCWELIEAISEAEDIYPVTETDLEEQRRCFQRAIGCCGTLLRYIELLHNELPQIDINKLANALELILQERKLLRGAMNSAKLRIKR